MATRHNIPLAFAVVLASSAVSTAAPPDDPVADINAQYDTLLTVIKNPSVTGVLVTELLPESAAAAAGLRAGDIITEYYGEKIPDLATLRAQVADAVAERLQNHDESPLNLRGRRITRGPGGTISQENIVIRLPRQPLGIRAVEVTAGVAAPSNPPPDRRGTVKLDWNALLETLRADDGVTVLRTDRVLPPPDSAPAAPASTAPAASTPPADPPSDTTDPLGPAWLGWQRYTITSDDNVRLNIQFEIVSIDPDTGKPAETLTFAFCMQTGDYENTPAFLLETAEAHFPGLDDRIIDATATRLADTLQTQISTAAAPRMPADPPIKHTYTIPLTAIAQPCVPLVGAAMPHTANIVLPMHLVSVRDFLPRPGYVLITRGQQTIPQAASLPPASTSAPAQIPATLPTQTGWRVDLLHLGVVVESYWFSDQRRLLCIASEATSTVISRRVADPNNATQPEQLRVEPADHPTRKPTQPK